MTQLSAARAVCGYRSYYWSTKQLLKACNWLSVNQLYWQQVLMTSHKILLSKRPVNIHSRMVTRHPHITRTAAGVSQGFGNKTMRGSFNYSAVKYNSLPAKLKEITNLASFKNQLRSWIEHNIDM